MWRSEYIFKYWSNSESLETAETSLVYGIHYAKWEQIVIGYTKEGNIETPYSSFDKFFDFVRNTPNKQGTLYINDIELVEPIIIPEGFDITLVANNANGVEILTEVAECDAFSIPTNSSLTLLGNITLIGPGQLVSNGYDQFVRAFRVEGTLNLGDLDNQGEYPTIQGFSGDGIIPNDDLFYGGAAIYAYGGTINIYNAHLMNNYVMETSNRANVGGAIYMIESTLNFYNGEIRENYARYAGGAIFARSSTLNMHGGYIVGNASEEAEGVVYLSDSFFNVYDGFINDNLCTGNGNAIQVYLNNSVAMIVGGDIELNDTDVYDSYVFHTYGGEFENNQLNPKEFPVATRRGYTFEYWRESASSGTAATKFGCGIYYAKWKKLDNFFDSISSYRGSGGYTAPSKEGQIFAGWYEDAEFTTPIPKNATSGSAFEKFVDAKVMDVKAQITAGTTEYSTSTNMRIVSTVDSLMYSDAGFMITINKTTKQISCKKVFTKLVAKDGGTVFDYAPTYFSESSKYFTTYTINNIPKANFGTAIKITPYWVTMDGTMVKGNEVIKTVYDCLG